MSAPRSTIAKRIGLLRGAVRAALGLGGLAAILLAGEALVGATLLLDRVFELEAPFRLAFLAIALGILGLVLWKGLLTGLLRPLAEGDLALALERSHPQLKQALVSALGFSRRLAQGTIPRDESPALMARVVATGEALAQGSRAGRALAWPRVRAAAGSLLVGLGLLGGGLAAFPGTLAIWAQRQLLLRDTPWPRRTRLEVLGLVEGRLLAPRGEELPVVIAASGEIPGSGSLRWRAASGWEGSGSLVRLGRDRLRYLLPTVTEELTLHGRAGDGRVGPIPVIPVDRPQLTRLSLTKTEPGYTGRPPREVDLLAAEGRLAFLAGSQLLLAGEADHELASFEVGIGRENRPGEIPPGEPRTFRILLEPRESLEVELRPRDRLGLAPKPAPRVQLQWEPDRPPAVTLKAGNVGPLVTPRVRIPLQLAAEDDVGLDRVGLEEARAAEDAAHSEELPFTPAEAQGLEAFLPGEPSFQGLLTWRPGAARLEPGQLVLLRARARDRLAPGPAQEGCSPVLRFKVVDEETLLKELRRRQAEVRSELEAMQDSLKALLADLAASPAADPELPGLLHGLATRLAGAAGRLEAVLDEWGHNELPGTDKMEELRSAAVAPLRDVAAPALVRARDQAAVWVAGAGGDARTLTPGIQEAVAILRRVLLRLARLEDYQRVLELARALLSAQGQARDAARRKMEEALRDLLGGRRER